MGENCSVEGCERPAWARGWCQSHWKRWSRHGNPLEGGPIRTHQRGACSVEGCETPRSARGLCPKHYQRWVRHGDPLAPTHTWTKRLERLPNGTLTAEQLRLRHRSRMLHATYGITHEQYEAMAEAQQHRCKLCGERPTASVGRGLPMANLVVDHDHATGAIRGLLCFRCNIALGVVETTGLDRIAEYLAD